MYCTWYVLQTGEMTYWNTGTIFFFFSVNWGAHWFEYFPNPPINILAMIENVLAHHDKYLLQHFVKYGVTSQVHFLNCKLHTWYPLFMKEKDFQKKYWYMYEWFEQKSGRFCWMQCLFIWSVQCSVDFVTWFSLNNTLPVQLICLGRQIEICLLSVIFYQNYKLFKFLFSSRTIGPF